MRSRNAGAGRQPLAGSRARIAAGPGAPGPALVAGCGAVVTDDAGREYLDLLGGTTVDVLGHAHPAVVTAMSAQIATLGQAADRDAAEPAVLLGHLLTALTGCGQVSFTNSGAEANEAAVTSATRAGRTQVVAVSDGPGRLGRAHPVPGAPGEVTHVPFGDVEALRAAVGGATAMVVVEPIQGESGAVVPPPGYLAAARQICTATGALLLFDEVRAGLGRTGHWFHYQGGGVQPDLLTVADGLGGGLPLGACLAFGPVAGVPVPGATSGGNPVSCAAGLAVIRTIAGTGLLDHVKRVGDRLRGGIEALAHPLVDGVRGAGLLLGVQLAEPVAAPVADRLRTAGFLVGAVRPAVLRLAPPLILTAVQADAFVTALEHVLGGVPAATSGKRLQLHGVA